jgi:hypothetical protein
VATAGTELLKQLMEGEFDHPATETVELVRNEVTTALAELIDRGFRARPIRHNGQQIGLVRGMHLSERRQLFLWHTAPADRIFHILALATTLSPEMIEGLDGIEAQKLLRLIDQCTDADLSLYPYVSAFTSTSTSEVLWYGRGTQVAAWTDRQVVIPGGYTFTLLSPPDHSRLWAGVASLRERSKRRIDETYNAAIIARALTGKGADKLYATLKANQQTLQADLVDPWMQIVRSDLKDIDFSDGWGHAHQDDSIDGIMREVQGMAKMDKHEKFMEDFYKKQMDAQQAQEHELEERYQKALAEVGMEESYHIMTDQEVRQIGSAERLRSEANDASVMEAMQSITEADDRRDARHGGTR